MWVQSPTRVGDFIVLQGEISEDGCKIAITTIDNGIINVIIYKEERMMIMTWKDKVIKLMNERDMTQKQLSQLSGITESSISRYLHNDQRPRMDIVVNIAKALQVETEYLLDEDEKGETAYNAISTAIARKGNELTAEEKNRLIALLLGTK